MSKICHRFEAHENGQKMTSNVLWRHMVINQEATPVLIMSLEYSCTWNSISRSFTYLSFYASGFKHQTVQPTPRSTSFVFTRWSKQVERIWGENRSHPEKMVRGTTIVKIKCCSPEVYMHYRLKTGLVKKKDRVGLKQKVRKKYRYQQVLQKEIKATKM